MNYKNARFRPLVSADPAGLPLKGNKHKKNMEFPLSQMLHYEDSISTNPITVVPVWKAMAFRVIGLLLSMVPTEKK